MIIDPRNNYRIDEKSDNRNLNEYEEQAKKAYTIVKQKRKVEKYENRFLSGMFAEWYFP